jgi:hypothetical protein
MLWHPRRAVNSAAAERAAAVATTSFPLGVLCPGTLLAVVSAGAGIALLGAGVLRLRLRGRPSEARSVAITPTPGGGLVTVAGSF